ncbi:hypothetical protein [Solilutibacter pythonis]|uniref:hypothetical protein n=1 Tax=Solilutibacter pythonis TaxID=2483112 RepID=UPI0011C345D5|nr:hypothetical protein [Lysobacter pythonis]
MNTQEAQPPPNPTLSAEEVGRRFLKFIEGVESRDDITLERVQEVMGLTLDRSGPNGPFFHQPLGNGWSFNLQFITKKSKTRWGVELDFSKEGREGTDTPPTCPMDFKGYHESLTSMGYQERPHHDQINGDIGRLLNVIYQRNGLTIGITPELKQFPNGGIYPSCIKRIALQVTESGV